MNKIKITPPSFEHDGSEFCVKCKFAVYNTSGDYYWCRAFNNKSLEKKVKDNWFETLRCQECIDASTPINGGTDE